jgi:hypothetical protein
MIAKTNVPSRKILSNEKGVPKAIEFTSSNFGSAKAKITK